jgi:hypothetical protein
MPRLSWKNIRKHRKKVFALLLIFGYVVLPDYFSWLGPNADGQYECPAGRPGDPDMVERPSRPPVLKIINLTDEGELIDRCQWTDALYELTQVKQPEIIVMYVHGWKHNSAPDDSDRKNFEQLVKTLTDNEKQTQRPRHVIGIYIGWQGLSSSIPVVRELTFWARKRAADRISQSAILTKLIGAIESIVCRRNQPDDLVLFVGHSSGARILYNATSQVLLYNVQMQHPGRRFGTYGIIKGPADLIVLLNPAFESSIYTALDSVRRYQETFSLGQQPVLLSISTNNDWATRYAFPSGQWLGFSRRERQLVTLGNHLPYSTHSLSATENSERAPVPNQRPWFDSFCRDGICLKRQDDRQQHNPFLVAKTEQTVLDGHNGIWKPAFVRWLHGFIVELDQSIHAEPAKDPTRQCIQR